VRRIDLESSRPSAALSGDLLDLLQQRKIQPLIAQRFPLDEARRAQELRGREA
jgi:NADPH:quinone reductase-like Zn-dependent oxidoreductase